MNMKPRVQLTDTGMSAMIKVADGNPGAVTVLIQLFEKTDKIDPDAFLGGLGSVLSLDDAEIYGSDIWVLYKDVCHESIPNVVLLFRARQLGFIPIERIKNAIAFIQSGGRANGKKEEIDFEDLKTKVTNKLPNFNMEA